MSKFRCAYAVLDELHHFAALWLEHPVKNAPRILYADGAKVERLYVSHEYQIERCTVPAGFVIPNHTHPRADTIEVGVSGAVRLSVNGVDPFAAIPDDRLGAFTRGRGIRINAVDSHGGVALADGAVFLSVQRWVGAPMSVLTDYQGDPLGAEHEALAATAIPGSYSRVRLPFNPAWFGASVDCRDAAAMTRVWVNKKLAWTRLGCKRKDAS